MKNIRNEFFITLCFASLALGSLALIVNYPTMIDEQWFAWAWFISSVVVVGVMYKTDTLSENVIGSFITALCGPYTLGTMFLVWLGVKARLLDFTGE